MLTYTPSNNKDYGTLMCSAANEVGHQRAPCIFHIILAGKTDIFDGTTNRGKTAVKYSI